MQTYLKFGALTTVIVGSLVWLALGGISDTKAYYKTIPELARMGNSAQTTRLRIAGDVQPGSILREAGKTRFTMHQDAQVLRVVYTGIDPLPDTFKDNSQALAEGRMGPDGVFEASKIQAKCASKYESKPSMKAATHQMTKPVGGS